MQFVRFYVESRNVLIIASVSLSKTLSYLLSRFRMDGATERMELYQSKWGATRTQEWKIKQSERKDWQFYSSCFLTVN